MTIEDRSNLFQNDAGAESRPAGQPIFRTGDACDDVMYAVAEGEVDIILEGATVETVRPGGFFGEIGLIDKRPRSADAVARTDVRLVPINARRFTFLVQQHPFFALEVMRTMAQRIRRLSAA